MLLFQEKPYVPLVDKNLFQSLKCQNSTLQDPTEKHFCDVDILGKYEDMFHKSQAVFGLHHKNLNMFLLHHSLNVPSFHMCLNVPPFHKTCVRFTRA